MPSQFETPILLLIFNRLSTTKQVLAEIKKQKPKYLFIASDGPRDNKVGEQQLVNEVRDYVLNEIDWPCEVKTLFREENLGCGIGVSSAITWFFSNVEMGIILEDDCLPLQGFFKFCEEMLLHYRHDESIFEVASINFQANNKRGDGYYYYSNYGGIWGWATWARAWKHYDYEMKNFNVSNVRNLMKKTFKDTKQREYWIKIYQNIKDIDTWDYQWFFTKWNKEGLSLNPNITLIKNLGFNSVGTHMQSKPTWYDKLHTIDSEEIPVKIDHPKNKLVSFNADNFLFENAYRVSFKDRIRRKLSQLANKLGLILR